MMMDWTTCSLSDWAINAKTRQCLVQHAGRPPSIVSSSVGSGSQPFSGTIDAMHMLHDV